MKTIFLFVALLLAGCPVGKDDPVFIEGHWWIVDKSGLMPCSYRRWVWLPEDQDELGYWRQNGYETLIAHVVPDLARGRNATGLLDCDVISKVPELVARAMLAPALPWGFATETVFRHEERHWREGFIHPNNS